jgi:HAD superfamily hydrolase (TIGR01549 family)
MLKLITLDLDNTLWNVTPTLIRAEKMLASWVNNNVPEAKPFYQKENLTSLRQQFNKQHPDKKYFPTIMRKTLLKQCFLQSGLSNSKAEDTMEAAFSIFIKERNNVDFFPETLDILKTLSKQYPIIALTNGNADLSLIGIEDFFTAHFSAESTGKPKPDTRMFIEALATTKNKAVHTLHIGDHPTEDIQAASSLGMYTMWFNQNQKKDSSLCNPTVEIHTLNDVLPEVEKIHQRNAKNL